MKKDLFSEPSLPVKTLEPVQVEPEGATALTTTRPMPLEHGTQVTPLQILQAAVQGGVTEANVAVVERMAALAERFEARQAEKEFNRAFSELQKDLPVIVASTPIKNRGKYEKFEDLMRVIGPLMAKHGFSVSFSNDFQNDRVIETCTLRHSSGHSQQNSFGVRGRPADNNTQADCMAATTAKRNALCNALNIVIRQDCLTEEQDPRMESDKVVTKQQADELERRVALTNSDKAKFLEYAGAKTFSEIPAVMYDELDRLLAKREK